MRILLAGQAYYREDNGQAVFTVRLARGLAAAGHDVTVLAPTDDVPPGSSREDGVRVRRLRTLSLPHNANLSLFPARAVGQALEETRPDIIHLQDHYFICRALWRHAKKYRIPVVGSNHFLPENLTANLPVPALVRQPLNTLLWRHMLALYNRLDAVSTPTGTAAAILHYQSLVPPVTPISCGIDTRRFKPVDHRQGIAVRKHFSLPPNAVIFLYVGRLDREKGLDTVVQAFAALESQDVFLVLAGKGSYRNGLGKLARSLGVTEKTSFPGFISDKDLPLLLAACDCFVMAGFAELQSIATLEAMACGLPVLAANARALPELVEDGKNGFLFTPRDVESLCRGMMAFLRSRDQWPIWGQCSREKALAHAMEKTVESFCRWYQSVKSNTWKQGRPFSMQHGGGMNSIRQEPPSTIPGCLPYMKITTCSSALADSRKKKKRPHDY